MLNHMPKFRMGWNIKSKVIAVSVRVTAALNKNKKSPQIVGLRPPMCSQIFSRQTVIENPLNILVNLLLWLHNAYQFKVLLHLLPSGRNLKGKFWDPKFCGLEECKRVGIRTNRMPTHDSQYLLMQRFALSAVVWPQFQCQVMNPQFDLPFGDGG